uniref:Uncharacterized protein n=1 Tax=Anguilla anguilla TaxID=7936 RepID=A0A0E9VFG6_ANGAN
MSKERKIENDKAGILKKFFFFSRCLIQRRCIRS